MPSTASSSDAVVGPVKQRRLLDRLIPRLAVLAVLLPLGVALASLNSLANANLTFADRERDGVTYLGPLVHLLSTTVDAQSAAVAGKTVDITRLKSAAHDVDAVDARLGAALGTTDRWGELRTRLDQASGSNATPQATYRTYSVVIDLELALIARVGDTSNLILDPELDAYYVMDATLLRVPAILTDGGKSTSLTGIAESSHGDADRLAAAVATTTVRSNMALVDVGLRKSFNSTRSRTLASGLLTPLDRLRDAVTTFAPPTLEVGVPSKAQDRAQADLARTAVRDAALAFESSGLTELDALLASRRDAMNNSQRLVLGVAVAGLLVAAGLAAWAGVRRRAPRPRGLPDPRVDLSFVDAAPGGLVGAGRVGPSAQGKP